MRYNFFYDYIKRRVWFVKLNARHLTVDLYNCKNSQLTDIELIKETLKKSLSLHGASLISLCCEKVGEGHHALMGIWEEGHISLQIYGELRYVAMDIFLCQENAQPEAISKAMRAFFKPDKTKTTVLKRGNFGVAKEIKPKITTKVAPLRKIHKTGAKVIRALARRNHQ